MIKFLKATANDADDYMAAKIDAFTDEINFYKHSPPNFTNKEHWLEVLKTHNVYKIVDNDTIIGGMTCMDIGDGVYYIGSVYVIRDHQDRGIGTKAMNFLFNEYPQAKRWELKTPYLSYKNHHFYEKMGFVKVGETEPEGDGFYLFEYEKNVE